MTQRTDHMYFAAFCQASTTYGSMGAWAHPRSDPGVLDADYYINLARSLERSGFDFLFFDDRLAMPGAFGNSIAETVRYGSRAIKLDILTILALVASHTNRIGLGGTYSTTYFEPYHVARAFSTLDHLSGGRAVWNIVTSLNQNEAENFGVPHLDPDGRYDRADEFLDIATQLWESWEPDALKVDRTNSLFADPDKVHEIDYKGEFLSARGPLTVPASPQGWPVLLQAGQSGRGMSFAAKWADMIFVSQRSVEKAQNHYRALSDLITEAGRNPGDVKVLPSVRVIVAETNEIAQQRLQYFKKLASPQEELIFISEQASFDFSQLPMDEPIRDDLVDSIKGSKGLVAKYVDAARARSGPEATLRDLAEGLAEDNSAVWFVGDPEQVADQLSEWFYAEACDGFAIGPADSPGSYEDFGRMVMPVLRRRGLVPEESTAATTFRERVGLPDRRKR